MILLQTIALFMLSSLVLFFTRRHEKFTLKAGEIGRVNPPKFEKCEDMVNLTFLNDASVFWNLKTRYQAKMIHTYSGLFVVVVNPYKRYPLYTHRVCKIYLGKRRNEVSHCYILNGLELILRSHRCHPISGRLLRLPTGTCWPTRRWNLFSLSLHVSIRSIIRTMQC